VEVMVKINLLYLTGGSHITAGHNDSR